MIHTERKRKLEEVITNSERIVIDKILCPRLHKLSPSEQQNLLSEFDKFIISEREYFQQKDDHTSHTI